MTSPAPPAELVDHLCRHSPLTAPEAERLIVEVLTFYTEGRDGFIRRRHRELKLNGLANAVIFQRIERELSTRRFPADPLSERQIRRVIYG